MLKLLVGLVLMGGGIVGGFLAKDGWSELMSERSDGGKSTNVSLAKNTAVNSADEDNSADTSSKNNDVAEVPPALETISNPGLTYQNVLDALEDESLSELQIQQFVKKNRGRRVTWTVSVSGVKSAFDDDDSDIYVAFIPKDSPKTFPDVSIAVFSREHEGDLLSISAGDTVVIEGDVAFNKLVSWSVNLENADILKFSKAD